MENSRSETMDPTRVSAPVFQSLERHDPENKINDNTIESRDRFAASDVIITRRPTGKSSPNRRGSTRELKFLTTVHYYYYYYSRLPSSPVQSAVCVIQSDRRTIPDQIIVVTIITFRPDTFCV